MATSFYNFVKVAMMSTALDLELRLGSVKDATLTCVSHASELVTLLDEHLHKLLRLIKTRPLRK